MKKKIICSSVLTFLLSIGAFAQDSTSVSQPQQVQQAQEVQKTENPQTKKEVQQPATKATPKRQAAPTSNLEGTDLTLKGQFDLIINKSESYQHYKVIKKTSLNKLKENTLDTINVLKQKKLTLEENQEAHNKEINQLKDQLSETQATLDKVLNEKNSFSFLGFLMPKTTYNTIVWLIVLALAAAIGILIVLFKRSHVVTAKTQEALNEKQEEFDKHRKWALEREQKLARELNKIKQKYKGLE